MPILGWGILAIGLLLRLFVYIQNRGFIIDESNLARNIVQKDFSAFFSPLDFHQYAPPLFSVIQKCNLLIFGKTEYALRLFPLLAGIIALWLFYKLAKKLIPQPSHLFPLSLMALSIWFVRYATEHKQYASDTALAIGLLLLAEQCQIDRFKRWHFAVLALGGSIAIWVSMPAVFILAGVGIYYLMECFYKKRDYLLPLVLSGMTWLVSFGMYYKLILSQNIGSTYLEVFHERWFLPLLPSSMEELNLTKELLLGIFRTAIGSTGLALAWGIATCILGIFLLFKKDKAKGVLYFLPVFFCLVASHLHYYTLIPRLTLFFIPIILLWIGLGTNHILERLEGFKKVPVLILLSILLFNHSSHKYFYSKLQFEELKPVMEFIKAESNPSDVFYIHHEGHPNFHFYNEDYELAYRFPNRTLFIDWRESLKDLLNKNKVLENQKVWLIFSHAQMPAVNQWLEEMKIWGSPKKQFSVEGASCYYYELIVE